MTPLTIPKENSPWQLVNKLSFILLLIGGWFYYPLGYFLLFCMGMAMGTVKRCVGCRYTLESFGKQG